MADEKKAGFFQRNSDRISRFMREMRSELKKVVWPTRKQVLNNSLIVLICVVVMGTVTFAFDSAVGAAIQGLISLFKG